MTRPHTELHTTVVFVNQYKTKINNDFLNNIFENHPLLICSPNASTKFSHFQKNSDQDNEDDDVGQQCRVNFRSCSMTKQSSNRKSRFITTYVMSVSLCFHGKMNFPRTRTRGSLGSKLCHLKDVYTHII